MRRGRRRKPLRRRVRAVRRVRLRHVVCPLVRARRRDDRGRGRLRRVPQDLQGSRKARQSAVVEYLFRCTVARIALFSIGKKNPEISTHEKHF